MENLASFAEEEAQDLCFFSVIVVTNDSLDED